MTKQLLRKSWRTLQKEGVRAFLRKVRQHLHARHPSAADASSGALSYEARCLADAPRYRRWLEAQRPTSAELLAQSQAVFPRMLLISIVVPVYDTEPRYLRALVDSILAQSYPRWELILTDGSSARPETLDLLERLPQEDHRIRVLRLAENRGISGNTNAGLAAARGAYIAFSDHDDTWEPDALYEVVRAIHASHLPADVVYTDEDKMDAAGETYYEPHRKPDFSPEKLQFCNYINHLAVVSRDVLDRVGPLRPAFDGSQDHEFILRACDAARAVCHVPRVLYHWRQFGASMSKQHLEACQAAGRKAVAEHLVRRGLHGTVTQDCGYRISFETPEDAAIAEIPVDLSKPHLYAALNKVAEQSQAEYLLFRDARLAPIEAQPGDALHELLMYAQQPEIGCVTGRLLLPRGDTLCLTDWMLAPDGPRPDLGGQPLAVTSLGAREYLVRNIAAAPLALFLVRREAFLAVGGFDAQYDRAFGDIDLCTRMRAQGLRHVTTPFSVWRFAAGGDTGSPQEILAPWFSRSSPDWVRFAADPAHFEDPYSRLPYTEECTTGDDPSDPSDPLERNSKNS